MPQKKEECVANAPCLPDPTLDWCILDPYFGVLDYCTCGDSSFFSHFREVAALAVIVFLFKA